MKKKNVWKYIIEKITIIKFYIQRSSVYLSIGNSIMLIFLLLGRFGIKISINKIWQYILIITGWIILMIFIGYMDNKLGLYKKEIKISKLPN